MLALLASLSGLFGLASVLFSGAVLCVLAWILLGPRYSFLV